VVGGAQAKRLYSLAVQGSLSLRQRLLLSTEEQGCGRRSGAPQLTEGSCGGIDISAEVTSTGLPALQDKSPVSCMRWVPLAWRLYLRPGMRGRLEEGRSRAGGQGSCSCVLSSSTYAQ
jgi:hypothetical protein